MRILVLGGTRFFGIHMINELLLQGHSVTIATRGQVKDSFGRKVSRIILDRNNPESIKNTLSNHYFDIVIDKLAYSSNDLKNILDVVECDKYILMSSTAVYDPKHWNTSEEEFGGKEMDLVWCNRNDYSYDEVKRQAECALWKVYHNVSAIAVRYPFVIGKDDYTNRILFYVEHVIKEIPMNIDNVNNQMSYIRSDEAGKFMAYLVDQAYIGSINGCSVGTISIREMLDYVEMRTNKKAIINNEGDEAPFNSEPEYSINSDRAYNLGFRFSDLKDWIFDLLDYYIEKLNS